MMHSSTSSSEVTARANPSKVNRYLLVAVGLLAVSALVLEMAIALVFPRVAHMTGRQIAEHDAAIKLQPRDPASGNPTVLVVGNSLLRDGVDLPKLVDATKSRLAVSRWVMEATTYPDWYFGFRKFFDEGGRPHTVVLTQTTRHLMYAFSRGQFFARNQMRLRDLPEVARFEGLTNTQTSDYFFAHFSSWLAYRSDIRRALFLKLMPNGMPFFRLQEFVAPKVPSEAEVDAAIAPRLAALKAMGDQYGVRFVILLPPIEERPDGTDFVQRSGERAGMIVLKPVDQTEFHHDLWSDTFHLTEEGARRFTPRLAAEMLEKLPASPNRH